MTPPAAVGEETGSLASMSDFKQTESKIEVPSAEQAKVFFENSTFEWLAQEIKTSKHRFDPDLVDSTFIRAEKMKGEYERVQRLCILINKRQQLLGLEKTEFSELKRIQDDLKPLYELWAVASRFNSLFPQWLEGNFEMLDAGEFENTLEEWLIELKKLQKTQMI